MDAVDARPISVEGKSQFLPQAVTMLHDARDMYISLKEGKVWPITFKKIEVIDTLFSDMANFRVIPNNPWKAQVSETTPIEGVNQKTVFLTVDEGSKKKDITIQYQRDDKRGIQKCIILEVPRRGVPTQVNIAKMYGSEGYCVAIQQTPDRDNLLFNNDGSAHMSSHLGYDIDKNIAHRKESQLVSLACSDFYGYTLENILSTFDSYQEEIDVLQNKRVA